MAYREAPKPPPMKGPCSDCRYLLGDYCVEDGTVLAPGACEHFERRVTLGELLTARRFRLGRGSLLLC